MYRYVICCVMLLALVGCEARTQVARDKILAKIDKWLGELDVKRQKIENKRKELVDAVEEVRKKKIQAQVRLEEYENKTGQIEKDIQKIKSGLEVLRPHLSATEAVEINNKSYEPAEINDMANKIADDYEALNEKLGAYKATMKAFQQSYDLLSAQQSNFSESMKRMDQQLSQIDAKKEAIEGMKTAQTILGEGGSISDRFTELENEINDLFIDVEAEMRVENEKIAERERDLNSRSADVDSILKEIETVDTTASRIDAILGGSGGSDDSSNN